MGKVIENGSLKVYVAFMIPFVPFTLLNLAILGYQKNFHGRTDRQTDRQTDKPSYRSLKMMTREKGAVFQLPEPNPFVEINRAVL